MRELKLKGQVRRVLVVAPKGLVSQWVAEMQLHFGEHFQLMLPGDLHGLGRMAPAISREYENADTAGDAEKAPQEYHELLQEHKSLLSREQEKAGYYFAARRKMIEGIGLPEVRAYRFKKLEQEEQENQAELQKKAEVLPVIEPLLMLRIQGEQ